MKEQWKDVPGYGGSYSVSDAGEVRSHSRVAIRRDGSFIRSVPERVLKKSMWGPYYCVTLFKNGRRKRFTIQCLVMLAFVGVRPKGMEICHNDGTYTNNRLSNLRYDNRIGNFADKYKHGTALGHRTRKLTADDVHKICRELTSASQSELARRFKVDVSAINSIARGRNWRRITSQYFVNA
jgi:hypothetical protein